MADAVLETVAPAPEVRRATWRPAWLLLPILLLSGAAMAGAMRRTSTTFDEILLPTAGARGYAIGKFDLVLDHPPLLQYVYGLPVFLSGPLYPPESMQWDYRSRYIYARRFFFHNGNDPRQLALLARLGAVLISLGLVALTWAWGRRFGEGTALLAAALVAFLPDVLAHGGISYNDVPMAAVYLLAAWALDGAARRPTFRQMALAGAACGLALTVKFSAIALAPLALVLFGLEAIARGHDRSWWRAVLAGTPLAALLLYLVLVCVYGGDFTLSKFAFGLYFNVRHAELGHVGFPAYLLGHLSERGFWYFFPVALFFKTPVTFHLLALLAIVGFVRGRSLASAGGLRKATLALIRSPLRMPVAAIVVFFAFLLSSHLDIGARHGLPLLPPLCLLVAAGAQRFALRARGLGRGLVTVLATASVVLSLSWYPHFLAYVNEYVPRDEGYRVYIDSSLDWGQELLDLRAYMQEHGIPSVYLSYFGTAEPHAYGIAYLPMPSFLLLPQLRQQVPTPRWLAVSATNLVGTYVGPAAFQPLRGVRPDAVLGHSMFLYRVPRNGHAAH